MPPKTPHKRSSSTKKFSLFSPKNTNNTNNTSFSSELVWRIWRKKSKFSSFKKFFLLHCQLIVFPHPVTPPPPASSFGHKKKQETQKTSLSNSPCFSQRLSTFTEKKFSSNPLSIDSVPPHLTPLLLPQVFSLGNKKEKKEISSLFLIEIINFY